MQLVHQESGAGLSRRLIAPGQFRERVEMLKFITSVATPELPQLAIAQFGRWRLTIICASCVRFFARQVQRTAEAVVEYFPPGCCLTAPAGGFVLGGAAAGGCRRPVPRRTRPAHALAPGPLFSSTAAMTTSSVSIAATSGRPDGMARQGKSGWNVRRACRHARHARSARAECGYCPHDGLPAVRSCKTRSALPQCDSFPGAGGALGGRFGASTPTDTRRQRVIARSMAAFMRRTPSRLTGRPLLTLHLDVETIRARAPQRRPHRWLHHRTGG